MLVPVVVGFLLIQSTVIVSPSSHASSRSDAEAARKRMVDNVLASDAMVPRSVDQANPLRVDDLASMASDLAWHRTTSESPSVRSGRSAVATVAPALPAPCRKAVDYPMGAKRASDATLNGRTVAFDCGMFVASVTIQDFSAPLADAVVAVGFPTSRQTAVVNGGALSRQFLESPQRRRMVVYQWIGKDREVELALKADARSFADLVRYGDVVIDAVTR